MSEIIKIGHAHVIAGNDHRIQSTFCRSDFSGIPDNGTYKIVNRKSGLALNVPEASADDKTQSIQFEFGGADNEKWVLFKKQRSDLLHRTVKSCVYFCIERLSYCYKKKSTGQISPFKRQCVLKEYRRTYS
ncbi:MAG: RICIN domain-containing protein [Roseburia sp.]